MTNYLQKNKVYSKLSTDLRYAHAAAPFTSPSFSALPDMQSVLLSLPSFFPCYSPLLPSFPDSLPVRVLAAADIWSGCLVIDWQVMRRLKGRWRQEQVFSTVFLASTKLPCPSLLHRTTPFPPSLTPSFPPSFPPFFPTFPPLLFLREEDYAIHHTLTRSDIDCLYMGKMHGPWK